MAGRAISFKTPSLGLVIGFFAIAAGLAGTTPVAARALDEVKLAGTLRVAVYGDNPPFSARPNGALAGVDVDLAKVVADRLGVSIAVLCSSRHQYFLVRYGTIKDHRPIITRE